MHVQYRIQPNLKDQLSRAAILLGTEPYLIFGELLDMISFLTTHCICHEVQQLCQKFSASFAIAIYIRTVIYIYICIRLMDQIHP